MAYYINRLLDKKFWGGKSSDWESDFRKAHSFNSSRLAYEHCFTGERVVNENEAEIIMALES